MEARHRLKMRCTRGFSSFEDQDKLYSQGRNGDTRPIVTRARAGQSFHNYGLAFDSCFRGADPFLDKHKDRDTIWNDFGTFCGIHGLTWGGKFRVFPDRPHAEFAFGMTIQELLALYDIAGIVSVWQQIDKIRGVSTPDWIKCLPEGIVYES